MDHNLFTSVSPKSEKLAHSKCLINISEWINEKKSDFFFTLVSNRSNKIGTTNISPVPGRWQMQNIFLYFSSYWCRFGPRMEIDIWCQYIFFPLRMIPWFQPPGWLECRFRSKEHLSSSVSMCLLYKHVSTIQCVNYSTKLYKLPISFSGSSNFPRWNHVGFVYCHC